MATNNAINAPLPLNVSHGGSGNSTLTGVLSGHGGTPFSGNSVTINGVAYGAGGEVLDFLGVAGTGTVMTGTGTTPAFSATPTLTSVTFGAGNPLSIYVTGSWTPGISFGGGTTGVTYTLQTGTYQQIGNIVHSSFVLVLSSKGSSTGNAAITGLPVAALNLLDYNAIRMDGVTLTAGYTYLMAQPNGSILNLLQIGSIVSQTSLTDVNVANTSVFGGTIVYAVP